MNISQFASINKCKILKQATQSQNLNKILCILFKLFCEQILTVNGLRHKYLLKGQQNYYNNLTMKQYHFKTMSTDQNSRPGSNFQQFNQEPASNSFKVSSTANIGPKDNKISVNYSHNAASGTTSTRNSGKPSGKSSQIVQQPFKSSNINTMSEMKMKLDQLLKQTELLSQRKAGSSVSKSFDQTGLKPADDNKSKPVNSSFNAAFYGLSNDKQAYRTENKSNQKTKFTDTNNIFTDRYKKQQFVYSNRSYQNLLDPSLRNLQKNKVISSPQSQYSQHISSPYIQKPIISPPKYTETLHQNYSAKNLNTNASMKKSSSQLKNNGTNFNDFPAFNLRVDKSKQKNVNKIEYNMVDHKDFNVSLTSSSPKKQKQQYKKVEIPDNLLQCQIQLRITDQDYRKLREQFDDMAEGKEYYRKELSQSWRNNKQLKEQYEQKISNIKNQHYKEITKLQQVIWKKDVVMDQKILQIRQQHAKEIEKLDEVIRQKDIIMERKIIQISNAYGVQIKKLEQTIQAKDANIVKLVNQLAEERQIVHIESYEEKAKIVVQANQQLTAKIQQKEQQITELKAQIISKDSQLDSLNQKIQNYQDQIKELSAYKQQNFISQAENFDQILKLQMKSIADFKQVVEKLNQKNNDLRQKIAEYGRKNQSLANENRISELKHKSSLNNQIMQSAIELTNRQNQISTLSKKISTLEQKYKSAVTEIKSKDEFFKQHLIGRSDSVDGKEYIEGVLQKYRHHFAESKEEQLKADLEKALEKIKLYQKYG